MGEDSARAAASKIDHDPWGAFGPGDVKKSCPKGCKKVYRIHPAIGVARVGNSPDQFFIGAETDNFKGPERFCTLAAVAKDGYTETLISAAAGDSRFKDKAYPGAKVRRQAARFRIFEYEELDSGVWKWTREVHSDDAEIQWFVNVANKKGAFHQFSGPTMMNPVRTGGTIEPGEKDFTVQLKFDPKAGHAYKRVTLDDPGKALDYLGEILHDEKGRLIFLGGRGAAKGPKSITDYANNDGWVDDVCDGSIRAMLKFPDGSTGDTSASDGDAWVMVGPPDFGPQLTNITSLYDCMLDVAARSLAPKMTSKEKEVLWTLHGVQDRATGKVKPPVFEHDLLRLFEATYQTNTVFAPANPAMKHPAVYKLAKNTKLDDAIEDPADVAKGIAPKAHVRYKVFNTLRKWDEKSERDPSSPKLTKPFKAPPAQPSGDAKSYEDRYEKYRWSMPLLWGDSTTAYTSVRNAVTELQYEVVSQWNDGKYKDTLAPDFDSINKTSIITPGGLDRAALERCVGGPYFPGIEASWLSRCPDVYAAPFRLDPKARAQDFVLGAFASKQVDASGLVAVGPGFFSQQMAQPWHADFLACARNAGEMVGWWPAQRPDDVIRGSVEKAQVDALKGFALAKAEDSTETVFDKKGKDAIKTHSRNVTITTRGKNAGLAPTEAKVIGKDERGNKLEETIKILRPADTYKGKELFAKLTSVSFKGVTKPAATATTLAIGLGKVKKLNTDEPSRIEIPTIVTTAPRDITTFDPKVQVEIHLIPRPILFTVAGVRANEAPLTATVLGKGPDGKTALPQKVRLPRKAGTATTALALSAVDKIELAKGEPKVVDDLEIAIGFGAFVGSMEPWAKGVGNFDDMVLKWHRLGFVYDGVEVERDPLLK